jgi:hypothetical protein
MSPMRKKYERRDERRTERWGRFGSERKGETDQLATFHFEAVTRLGMERLPSTLSCSIRGTPSWRRR